MRRTAPSIGLFLLAPLVAEFLLGNLSITALPALVLLAPLYGGGALLIREVVRRTSRGWPAILVLAVAYGVLEEGIATQSLFNPNYADAHLLDAGFIPGLGIAVPWTLFVLTLHTVWSISVPIVLVETLARGRGRTPWLGRRGLFVTVVLFVLGVAGTTALSLGQDDFVAPLPQLAGAVAVTAGLVIVALVLPAVRATGGTRRAPSARSVGAVSFLATGLFMLLPPVGLPAWLPVVGDIVLYLGVGALVWRWSGRAGWGDRHRLALAGGALLTYAWRAFLQQPVVGATGLVDVIGNLLFAAGAVVLLVVAAQPTASAIDRGCRTLSNATLPAGVNQVIT